MPHAAAVAAVHARRQLRLLRGLGLALRVPARRRRSSSTSSWPSASTGRPPSRRGRRWTAAAVVANLAALGWFKYAGFLTRVRRRAARRRRRRLGAADPDVVLPIGISFFTFQALSYVIDVQPARSSTRSRFLDFAVYLSFFPHLVAGPIVRAAEFLPQLRQRRDPRRVAGQPRLLADRRRPREEGRRSPPTSPTEIVDPLFAFPGQHGGVEALVGVYAYAIQIYADFSGYTDMAIGLALLLGFRFPQNFDAPYTAASLAGLLAALAHDAVALAARLPLHPARREPGRPPPHVPQPHAHDAARAGCGTARRGPSCSGAPLHGRLALPRSGGCEDDRAGGRHAARRTPSGRPALVTSSVVCLGWVSSGPPTWPRPSTSSAASSAAPRRCRSTRWSSRSSPLMLASQFVPDRRRSGGSGPGSAGGRCPPRPSPSPACSSLVDVLGPQGVPPFIYFQF